MELYKSDMHKNHGLMSEFVDLKKDELEKSYFKKGGKSYENSYD